MKTYKFFGYNKGNSYDPQDSENRLYIFSLHTRTIQDYTIKKSCLTPTLILRATLRIQLKPCFV